MNQELKKAVAEHIYHSVTDGKTPEQAAERAIKAVGEWLMSAIPDDSADDVREALGL